MSLQYQISVRILIISLCILFLGSSIGMWQARKSVRNEVDASINLALQLIKIGVGTNKSHKTDLMFRLSSLEETRHLNIKLKKTSGEIINITQQAEPKEMNDRPPNWFINLVVSEYPTAEYQIQTINNNYLTLLIQANPLDEITEVWHETIAFFATLFLLVLLTFLAVHLVLNNALQAIQSIVDHLKGIETGNYQHKLTSFSTQEFADIATAINHMVEVLDSTQKQNRALTQHSLQIQEQERQHLSQELHDEFGQSLTAIKVMAVAATHKGADTEQITSSIIEICDHLMTVLRSMMKQLHPLILTELGLKATLEDLLHHWEIKNTNITFNLQCDEAVDNIEQAKVIQIFRVIQESLTNIIRHAQASHANVSLDCQTTPDMLHLIINDNGQGCNIDQVGSGFGLLGMQERINLLGGEFKLQSQPNKGMQITAIIPL